MGITGEGDRKADENVSVTRKSRRVQGFSPEFSSLASRRFGKENQTEGTQQAEMPKNDDVMSQSSHRTGQTKVSKIKSTGSMIRQQMLAELQAS
ncbi:unnamed protein product, partial [Allacma fusca]